MLPFTGSPMWMVLSTTSPEAPCSSIKPLSSHPPKKSATCCSCHCCPRALTETVFLGVSCLSCELFQLQKLVLGWCYQHHLPYQTREDLKQAKLCDLFMNSSCGFVTSSGAGSKEVASSMGLLSPLRASAPRPGTGEEIWLSFGL